MKVSSKLSEGVLIQQQLFWHLYPQKLSTEDPTGTTKCVRVWSAGTGFPRAFFVFP